MRGTALRALSLTPLLSFAGRALGADGAPESFASPTIEPLLRMGLAVAFLGALAWGLSAWARSRQIAKSGGDARIDLLAVRNLGPRHRIAVVEVGHRRFLLGLGNDTVCSVAELTDPIQFSEAIDGLLPEGDGTAEPADTLGRFEGLDG